MDSITLVSCNIRFSTDDDGPHRWEARRALLARTLLKHAPLVLATQEGREPQLRDLAQHLPGLTLVAEKRPWIAERMYPCLFVDTTRAQVQECGDVWLSETPEVPGSSSFQSSFPRLCTWARVRIAGQSWLVANAHLDHREASTREQQARVLVSELSRIKRSSDEFVLMGDFNDSPHSLTRQVIERGFPELKDGWQGPEESSHHPFTGVMEHGQRIDWILTPARIAARVALDKSQEQGLWPSDHFPVVCELRP